ncbi:MAG: hypothetical protein BGO43_09890 [Gammaproteobacteria bacterium 39-13]|nr:YheC/YheD family protein [Gammaproteobacteria bacterium]OJV89069.1 MAG: hypothetical protein BGO43_09890 [Gammaproteobacteria bacterium 39-13]
MESIIDFFDINDNSRITQVRWIGQIFHTIKIAKLEDQPTWMMARALLLEQELIKHNYKLICYTPQDVNLKEKTVVGYMIENGQFKKICMPIPRINGEFYFGSKNHEVYHIFLSWALKHGYEIYPDATIRDLAVDKLYTAEVLSKYDKSIVPYTQIYRDDVEQLKFFLQKSDKLFIKPRFGRMGDGIFIIKQDNNQYLISYYYNAKTQSVVFDDLSDCILYIKENAEDKQYILQEAINVIRYDNAIFDLRIVMFSDEKGWHFLSEVRVGAKSSDVSNIHQGGQTFFTEEFLNKIFSKDRSFLILQKIKKTATEIVTFLNKKYHGVINELALDLLIDKDENLYVAELNTKPGLAGNPSEYHSYPQMSDNEKQKIEDLAAKNGKFLALSLMNRYRLRLLDNHHRTFKLKKDDSFELLILDSLYFNENYYKNIKPIMQNADFVLANLENATIVNNPEIASKVLVKHNFSLVSLSSDVNNNQTHQMFENLNILTLTAGIDKATRHFVGELHFNERKTVFVIFTEIPKDFDFQIKQLKEFYPNVFVILYQQWFYDNDELNHKIDDGYLDKAINLIIRYRNSSFLEIKVIGNSWMFSSMGKFKIKKNSEICYSLIISLSIRCINDIDNIILNLYPIISDTTTNSNQPRFLNENEFFHFLEVITSKMQTKGNEKIAIDVKKDKFGLYLEVLLGEAQKAE